jgi:hypothetical protein
METVPLIITPGNLHSSMLPNPEILSNTPTTSIKGVEDKKKIPRTALFCVIMQHVVVIPDSTTTRCITVQKSTFFSHFVAEA